MDFVLILYAQIFSLIFENTSSQYEYQNIQNVYYLNPYQNMYQNGYLLKGYQRQGEYEDPQDYQRSKKRRHKSYGNSGGMLPLAEDDSDVEGESEECKCSCDRCEDPDPCCRKTCDNCNIQNQQNFVFVPYPYPIIVTPKVTETPKTTTQKPNLRLQEVVTEHSAPTVQNPPAKTDVLRHRQNYMLTSLRRTKPAWLPKYGLVPIPDRLAEKLMSKLRELKDLNVE